MTEIVDQEFVYGMCWLCDASDVSVIEYDTEVGIIGVCLDCEEDEEIWRVTEQVRRFRADVNVG